MAPGDPGQQAAARRALQEALLQQERLDHLLQRVALLGQRRRQRVDADRAAAVVARRCSADSGGRARRARARRPRAGSAPRSAIAASTSPSPSTAAKSRTRRNSRIATRGVPRARRAISAAPSPVSAEAEHARRRARRSPRARRDRRNAAASGMPKRSRSGVVSRPVRVVAPISVNGGRSIRTERAAGPSPIIRSS